MDTMNTTDTLQHNTIPGYSLDSNSVVKILGLEFNDSFSSLLLSKEKYKDLNVEERYKLIERVLSVLDSATNKGFLSTTDLSRFPLLSELLQSFILEGCETARSEYINGSKSMESYKWLCNLILITLYQFCLETLHSPALSIENPDLIADLELLERELYGRLDPSVRLHLQKKGMSIKQNTYIGYDSEFTNKTMELNNLISIQLAVTTKTYVQIPKTVPYTLSTMDGNKVIKMKKSSSIFNYPKIETSIRMCVSEIRVLKYGKNDESMLVLTECLKMVKGLSYAEKDDYTVFSLPRSVIQPYISFCDSFSFKQIVEIASSISKPYLDESYEIIMKLIKNVSSNNLTIQLGKDRLLEEIYRIYNDYKEIEELGVNSEKSLPLLSEEYKEENFDDKRLTRSYITDLFPNKISVTKTKTYFIIAHLTPADLSLLKDFDEVKEDLSIVNGSYVTVAKPLRISGRNTHIRDTMLLAPGGSRSLASIGMLYGEMFQKISISKSDLEDMQGFLQRDREKFIEYALRDAVISLIHASWMEDFNFKIGGIGVGIPLTLSSIGRGYVKSIWVENKYPGYQISSKYLLGDVSASLTPKGLNVLKRVGFVLPYYIANYKGGRNECFLFGVDRDTV